MKSPWDDQFYIGFVLDVVKSYLDLENVDYYALHSHGPLSEVESASIVLKDKSTPIRILKTNESHYMVENFPSNRDFSNLQTNAQSLLEQILKR